jgi:hypothetical protein
MRSTCTQLHTCQGRAGTASDASPLRHAQPLLRSPAVPRVDTNTRTTFRDEFYKSKEGIEDLIADRSKSFSAIKAGPHLAMSELAQTDTRIRKAVSPRLHAGELAASAVSWQASSCCYALAGHRPAGLSLRHGRAQRSARHAIPLAPMPHACLTRARVTRMRLA